MAKKRPSPQSQAFLDDICAHPEDDGPRLVYADWLEENDDPARAELIRAQCRLAVLPEDSPERPELEGREWELLAQHQKRWLQELPAWVRKKPLGFQRGFVGRISV